MGIPDETNRDINPEIPGHTEQTPNPFHVICSQSSLSFWSLSHVPLGTLRG